MFHVEFVSLALVSLWKPAPTRAQLMAARVDLALAQKAARDLRGAIALDRLAARLGAV